MTVRVVWESVKASRLWSEVRVWHTSAVRRFGTALVAVLIGILVGAGLNAALGEKGADTPALALLGGALALVAFLVQARRRARKA